MTDKILPRHVNFKHGHGNPSSRIYNCWCNLKQRCYNPNTVDYKNYGARGIKVCDRWLNSFENFLEDMGEYQEGKTIDRIDNDGDYESGNCRWAAREEQNSNRRTVIIARPTCSFCRRVFKLRRTEPHRMHCSSKCEHWAAVASLNKR